MFIFLRLLLAHFLGDYPLQLNRIYALKFKGLKGVVPHIILVAICFAVLAWPYLDLPGMWVLIFLIGIIHLFQDWLKIRWDRIKEENYFWSYVLDQLFHILVIMAVFLTDLKYLRPPEGASFIVRFYNNDAAVIYLIAFIVATYNGFYLISNFQKTFLRIANVYSPFEKWYGMLERAAAVTIFFLGGSFFFLIPLVLFIRPLVFNLAEKKFGINKRFISPLEITLSWTIAVVTGAALYVIMRRFA